VGVSSTCPKPTASDCVNTATTGCLNGVSFEYSKSFACGPQQTPGKQAIFDWDKVSCCASGTPFDMSTGFCCNNGVHDYSNGECKAWDDSFPSWCYCYGEETSSAELELEQEIWAEPVVDAIDTLKEEANCPCGQPSETMGCLNGHHYNYTTQYPCGNSIANWAQTGCCPTSDGLISYNLRTQSCCRGDTLNVVHDYGHACECKKYGCNRIAV